MRLFLTFALLLLPVAVADAATKTFPLLNSYALAIPCLTDQITTNAWASFSFDRQVKCTATQCFRVARQSDLTQTDIGFVNGLMDTNSLLSFVGSSSGYIVLWYDQSGNGRNLTNNLGGFATNNSLRIVTSGVLETDTAGRPRANVWTNTTEMATAGFSISSSAATGFLVTAVKSDIAGDTVATFGNANQGGLREASVSGAMRFALNNGGSDLVCTPDFIFHTAYLLTWFAGPSTDSIQLNQNTAVTGNAGNNTFAAPRIGTSPNAVIQYINEYVIYDIALSAADTDKLQDNIMAFYSLPTAAFAQSLNTSLISYWKMDETSGTRIDSWGDDMLTDNNTVTSDTGKISNAGQFTAANSESLSHSDNASLSTGDIDYSIACWIKMTTKGTAPAAIAKGAGSPQNEFLFRYNQGTDRLAWYVINNGTASTLVEANNFGSPATNTWYFVVVWHDSVNNEIGIQVNNGTANTTATSAGSFDSTSAFVLGSFASANYWDGLIDEVGFWKKVLSSTEKTALYNSGSGKTCCPFTP